MVMALMHTRVRIHALIWIIVISIGFFGVQGGLIGIVSGGQSHIVGPPKSPIRDNNALALAMVISFPLMNYLRTQSEKKIIQTMLSGAMALSVIAVLSTYSRGGLLSLLGMFGFLWLRSGNKIIILIFAAIVLIPAIQFMPDKWTARMNTIEDASENDNSFRSRLRAWETSFNLAVDRPLYGGGFSAIQSTYVYTKYRTSTDPTTARAAHSIYFQVLGDWGYTGIILFLSLLFIAWRNTQIVIRLSKGIAELEWARELASMLQVSLVGFAIGGAALSVAYYDLVLTLIAVVEMLKYIVTKRVHEKQVPELQKKSL